MRTSSSEVQTQAERRVGQKASRANNHSCFDGFSRFRFSFSSEIKYCKTIFQHVMHKSFVGIALFRGGQTFRTKGRIAKNFEAEGRTDW